MIIDFNPIDISDPTLIDGYKKLIKDQLTRYPHAPRMNPSRGVVSVKAYPVFHFEISSELVNRKFEVKKGGVGTDNPKTEKDFDLWNVPGTPALSNFEFLIPGTGVQESCPVCGGSGTVSGCDHCHGTRQEDCSACHGTGYKNECKTCHGKGEVECTLCEGTGKDYDECPACSGGKIQKYKWINCSRCHGTGRDGSLVCIVCHGHGQIKDYYTEACEHCHGKGYVFNSKPCTRCGGKLKVTCGSCHGQGKMRCETCGGTGKQVCSHCHGQTKGRPCVDCYRSGKIVKSLYLTQITREYKFEWCIGDDQIPFSLTQLLGPWRQSNCLRRTVFEKTSCGTEMDTSCLPEELKAYGSRPEEAWSFCVGRGAKMQGTRFRKQKVHIESSPLFVKCVYASDVGETDVWIYSIGNQVLSIANVEFDAKKKMRKECEDQWGGRSPNWIDDYLSGLRKFKKGDFINAERCLTTSAFVKGNDSVLACLKWEEIFDEPRLVPEKDRHLIGNHEYLTKDSSIYKSNHKYLKDHIREPSEWIGSLPATAINILGWAYLMGDLVKKDDARALELFKIAATCGVAKAWYGLARWWKEYKCKDHFDVPAFEKLNVLYRKAANMGVADALYELGLNYLNGKGVGKNLAEARRLLVLAELKGNKNAHEVWRKETSSPMSSQFESGVTGRPEGNDVPEFLGTVRDLHEIFPLAGQNEGGVRSAEENGDRHEKKRELSKEDIKLNRKLSLRFFGCWLKFIFFRSQASYNGFGDLYRNGDFSNSRLSRLTVKKCCWFVRAFSNLVFRLCVCAGAFVAWSGSLSEGLMRPKNVLLLFGLYGIVSYFIKAKTALSKTLLILVLSAMASPVLAETDVSGYGGWIVKSGLLLLGAYLLLPRVIPSSVVRKEGILLFVKSIVSIVCLGILSWGDKSGVCAHFALMLMGTLYFIHVLLPSMVGGSILYIVFGGALGFLSVPVPEQVMMFGMFSRYAMLLLAAWSVWRLCKLRSEELCCYNRLSLLNTLSGVLFLAVGYIILWVKMYNVFQVYTHLREFLG